MTSAKHRFHAGQLLYSKIRPYLAKVVVVDFGGLCSADIYPIDTKLDPRYLKWWMLTREFTRHAASQQARTILPKINRRSLEPLPVPVAPEPEQRRIVEILEDHLSRLDAGKGPLRCAAKRLRALEAAALDETYEGALVPLGELATIQGGIQKQPKRAPRANIYPFLRVANVTGNGLDLSSIHKIELFDGELERLQLKHGDLLVVEGNGSSAQIGRAAVWNGSIENCVHQNHLIRVRPNVRLLSDYLEAVWNSPRNRRQLTRLASSSSGLHTLSVSKLRSLPIPAPALERQRDLVQRAKEFRHGRHHLNEAIAVLTARITALRSAVLEAAFSGRLTGVTSGIGDD